MKYRPPVLVNDKALDERVGEFFKDRMNLAYECEQWFLREIGRVTGTVPSEVTFEAWESDNESVFCISYLEGHPMGVPQLLCALTGNDDEELAEELWNDEISYLGPMEMISHIAKARSHRGQYAIAPTTDPNPPVRFV